MNDATRDEEPKGHREDTVICTILCRLMGLAYASTHHAASDASDIVACDLERRGVIHTARWTCTMEGGRSVEPIMCRLPDGIVLEVSAGECGALGGALAKVESQS